jgi:hypothetical protein
VPGFEPGGRVAAGQHVLFHAEGRDVEAVDDVLGGHRHLDRLPHRDVQLVDLPVALGMLELPHPLLGDGEVLDGVGRRPVDVEEDPRPPDEHGEADGERHRRPDDLEHQRHRGVLADLLLPPPPVAGHEVDDQGGDQQGEEDADHGPDVEQGVDLVRPGRGGVLI